LIYRNFAWRKFGEIAVGSISVRLKNYLQAHRNAVCLALAFFIPLAIRVIPEILMGPYPVGFDLMAFYVPISLLWLHNGVTPWTFLVIAPLFYSIITPIVAAGLSPFLVLKIVPPLLLGILGVSVYLFAKKGLGWSPQKSVFVALLGTLYFVALRASWDQLREELALVFFFVVLTLLMVNRKQRSWKIYALSFLAIMGTLLANQLVSVLLLGILLFNIAYDLYRKNYAQSLQLTAISLPATAYFLIFYLTGLQSGDVGYSAGQSPLASWLGFSSYPSMLVLPVTPVSPYRWVLLLTYPLAFLAVDALSALRRIKWKRFKITAQRIAIVYLVLSTAFLSLGFIFSKSESPFFYFDQKVNKFTNQIPTSMLQNTVSLADCSSTENALQWFKVNVDSNAVLLTHQVFYGWALTKINYNRVILYGYGDPLAASQIAASQGHSEIYIIWWVNGFGWYGMPTLPAAFHQVYASGQIAIYRYQPS
jgi:hypothetical protein